MSIPGYDLLKLSNYSPEQQKLSKNLFQELGTGGGDALSFLKNILSGNPEFFQNLEAPAYQNLEKGMAQTANRFSQVGAQGSSAFQNALAGQSSDLASQLQKQRSDLMMGATQGLLNQSNQMLNQKPYENLLQKQDQIDWGELIGKLGPEIIKLLPLVFGAPPVP